MWRCLAVLTALAACDPVGALGGDPSCAELSARFASLAGEEVHACTRDEDCSLISASDTCNLTATIGPCEGTPVARGFLDRNPRAADTLSEWSARCSDCSEDSSSCTWDCAPGIARCSAGRCTVAIEDSCFADPDAGVPDAGLPDAGLLDAAP